MSLTENSEYKPRLEEISLGMVLLGVIFSSILYGVMLTQTYKYYQRFRRDSLLVKLLVFAVLLLNTASAFFVGHAAWYYLVTTGSIKRSIWSLNVELALSVVMSGLSESFLAYRVYKLSGQKIWLTGILFVFVMLHFGSGEVAAIEFLLLKRFANFGSVKVPSILRLSSAAVCDTSIALSLSYFLHKKRTGFKKNDEIINYLILFSIKSGLLTSVTSIASLVTFVVVPKTWVYTALCFLISRLYATTFLCSLNSRQILMTGSSDSDIEKPNPFKFRRQMVTKPSTWSIRPSFKSPTQIGVFVVTETISDGPQSSQKSLRNSNGSQLEETLERDGSVMLARESSSSSSSTSTT